MRVFLSRMARTARRIGRALQPLVERSTAFGSIGPLSQVLQQSGHHVFFGYYDHSPFSYDETRVLAHRTAHPLVTPSLGSPIDVGVFHILGADYPSFTKIGSTLAWCWQQGSRLQWYPRDVPTTKIIYNTVEGGRFGTKIVCTESSRTIQDIPIPLYDVSGCGRYGLSLNFTRLQVLRPGYGYVARCSSMGGAADLDEDGIFLFDFALNTTTLFISLREIVSTNPIELSNGSWEHYVNHLSFSPDGEKFLFLHLMADGTRRLSRMFVADRRNGDVQLLNGSGRVSHYAWNGSNRVLVYCAVARDQAMHYWEYNLRDGTATQIITEPTGDGHPTYSEDGKLLITDTYPGRLGYQALMCFDLTKKQLIGRRLLYRDPKFIGEVRTDLHPRLSRTGRWVVVDDERKGWKAMKIFPVKYGS